MTEPARLNVCLISQEFPPFTNWGGVGVQFDVLARGLGGGGGHRVVVVSRMAPGANHFQRLESGVEVWRLHPSIWRKRFLGRTLDRILFARAAASTVRTLDEVRRFDIVESAAASLDADALAAASDFSSRTVICCHGSNFLGQAVGGLFAPLHRFDWAWGGRRELRMLDRARLVVVSSEATAQFVRSLGVAPSKMAKAALGVDTDRFHPREHSLSSSAAPLVVGFVGRLQPSKGIDFVWKVMRAIGPSAGIRFVFKGAIHPSVRGDVAARLDEFREFAEHLPAGTHEEMPAVYRSFDVLLLPSRFENFGLTYAEGLATGLLVIAGSGGAGPETVTDGVTGFIVDPDDAIDATVARLRDFARDRSMFDEIRKAGREDAVRRISVEQFIREKERQYRALQSGTSP